MIFWTVNLRAFSIIITHFRYKLIEQPKTQVQDDFSLSKLICYWFYFRTLVKPSRAEVIRGLTAVHVLTLGLHSILLIIWSNIQRVHFQDIGTTASLWTGRQQVLLEVRSWTTRPLLSRPYTRDLVLPILQCWGGTLSSWISTMVPTPTFDDGEVHLVLDRSALK